MDQKEPLPVDVPELIAGVTLAADLGYWEDSLHRVGPTLSWYCRHGLRRSDEKADHELADKAISRLRLLGTQITETGTMACASPVSRILAYSRAKAQALIPILKAEQKNLGDTLRAVVSLQSLSLRSVRTRRRKLLKLGIGRDEVHQASRARKGHWRMS